MRPRILVFVASMAICLGLSATAQTRDQLGQYCSNPRPEIRILACTLIIDMGQATAGALADAFTSRGTAYVIMGDAEHAIQDFDQAILLDPDRVLVFGYRGAAYLAEGDYDGAIADFDRATELAPDYIDALYGRASAWRAKGVTDQAIYDYTRVIALDPTYIEAFAYRGIAYLANDELGRAIDDFDEVIKLDPNNAEAFNLRGNAYRQMGEAGRAIKDYDEAIRLDPNYALAHFNRGIAKFVMRRFAEAALDFVSKPQAAPANSYAAFWLHMARSKAGEQDSAELSRNLASLDLDGWPGPIVRLYRGQATAQDVQTAAEAGADARTRQEHACQAAFYIAEYQLLRGNMNTAVPFIREAALSCPHDLPEYEGATAELSWLP